MVCTKGCFIHLFILYECYKIPAISSLYVDYAGTRHGFSCCCGKATECIIRKNHNIREGAHVLLPAHILLIHILATIGAMITGYKFSDMVLSSSVQSAPALKGYGFNLFTVYLVWIGLILILYPFCKWFNRYKKDHQSRSRWLSYL